jgi:hypothetical protein
VRRLVLLTAIAAMAITGVAYAVTNTLTYSGKVTYKGKPTTAKPANTAYTGTLHIDTNPPGSQPDTAPSTEVYFAKGIKLNAAYFPSCKISDIDGQPAFPSKCNKAIVGTGTATALAGAVGSPSSQSVKEDLTVKAVNGPKGKVLYLVLTSNPGAPVAINNRVVPGTVVKKSGTFAYLVRFDIPADLQQQLGLSISLTDFNVKISGTPKTVTIKKKKVKVAYLQLTSCKGSLPVKAVANFKDSSTGQTVPVTSSSTAKC